MQAKKVEYLCLNALEFSDAVYGYRNQKPWLASPTLKYYHAWSALAPEVERRVFMATAAKLDDNGLKEAVGILELQASPFNGKEWWLMFVSVHPQYQRQRIATQLFTNMTEYLKGRDVSLVRSRPSEAVKNWFTPFVDGLLNADGIRWHQNREAA